MRNKILRFSFFALVLVMLFGWFAYIFEPRMFNFDDGPYYSREFEAEIDNLPLQSSVELSRFGYIMYILESRLLKNEERTVLLLKQPDGTVVWKKVPVKPDGRLGPIALEKNYTHLTWYGGWKVAIKPAFQESGHLYLGPLGGFRFFYHSW